MGVRGCVHSHATTREHAWSWWDSRAKVVILSYTYKIALVPSGWLILYTCTVQYHIIVIAVRYVERGYWHSLCLPRTSRLVSSRLLFLYFPPLSYTSRGYYLTFEGSTTTVLWYINVSSQSSVVSYSFHVLLPLHPTTAWWFYIFLLLLFFSFLIFGYNYLTLQVQKKKMLILKSNEWITPSARRLRSF